ncbi:MAG: thiamine phosphate synthase [Leptospiraceae bacterium]|nr:thiamine phosphate synthase [Leptospiraceae bacterium]MDW8305630.1 thiamine phosphate synthase [Leptospiraceae bacterium]
MRRFHFASALYAILDKEIFQRQGLEITEGARALLYGGCRVFQYRNKISNKVDIAREAHALLRIAEGYQAIFVLNDGVEAYLELYKERKKKNLFFHFGQEDRHPPLFYHPFGRSTHSIVEVRQALRERPKPTYIGFGSVFHSPTKPWLRPVSAAEIRHAVALWSGPIVFIGGISLANLDQLRKIIPHQTRFSYGVASDLFRFGNRARDLERYALEFEREAKRFPQSLV